MIITMYKSKDHQVIKQLYSRMLQYYSYRARGVCALQSSSNKKNDHLKNIIFHCIQHNKGLN